MKVLSLIATGYLLTTGCVQAEEKCITSMTPTSIEVVKTTTTTMTKVVTEDRTYVLTNTFTTPMPPTTLVSTVTLTETVIYSYPTDAFTTTSTIIETETEIENRTVTIQSTQLSTIITNTTLTSTVTPASTFKPVMDTKHGYSDDYSMPSAANDTKEVIKIEYAFEYFPATVECTEWTSSTTTRYNTKYDTESTVTTSSSTSTITMTTTTTSTSTDFPRASTTIILSSTSTTTELIESTKTITEVVPRTVSIAATVPGPTFYVACQVDARNYLGPEYEGEPISAIGWAHPEGTLDEWYKTSDAVACCNLCFERDCAGTFFRDDLKVCYIITKPPTCVQGSVFAAQYMTGEIALYMAGNGPCGYVKYLPVREPA